MSDGIGSGTMVQNVCANHDPTTSEFAVVYNKILAHSQHLLVFCAFYNILTHYAQKGGYSSPQNNPIGAIS